MMQYIQFTNMHIGYSYPIYCSIALYQFQTICIIFVENITQEIAINIYKTRKSLTTSNKYFTINNQDKFLNK